MSLYASLFLESPIGLLHFDLVLSAVESLSNELPVLIHLEGVADGAVTIRMEQAEIILSNLVVVSVGEPAFEGIVVERHPGDEELDFKINGVRQILDDGFYLPQLAIFVRLNGPKVAVCCILHPKGVESRRGEDRTVFIESREHYVLAVGIVRAERNGTGDPIRRSVVSVAFQIHIKRRGRRFYEFNSVVHLQYGVGGHSSEAPFAGAAYEAGGISRREGAVDGHHRNSGGNGVVAVGILAANGVGACTREEINQRARIRRTNRLAIHTQHIFDLELAADCFLGQSHKLNHVAFADEDGFAIVIHNIERHPFDVDGHFECTVLEAGGGGGGVVLVEWEVGVPTGASGLLHCRQRGLCPSSNRHHRNIASRTFEAGGGDIGFAHDIHSGHAGDGGFDPVLGAVAVGIGTTEAL